MQITLLVIYVIGLPIVLYGLPVTFYKIIKEGLFENEH